MGRPSLLDLSPPKVPAIAKKCLRDINGPTMRLAGVWVLSNWNLIMKFSLKLIFVLILLNLLIVSSFLLYTHVYKHINNEIIYLIIIGSYALTFYVARKLKMITLRYKRPDIRQVFEWSLISLFIWLISLVEINILNPNFNYFEHHENRHTLISGLYYLISAPLIEEGFMKSIFMESLITLI